MLGLPKSTEFNKRLPKQKFYENLTITPALKKRVIDDIRIIYWRNKIAASTMNLAAGQMVTEIEVFEIRWNTQTVNEALQAKIRKEKQLNKQMEMNAELKKLRNLLTKMVR